MMLKWIDLVHEPATERCQALLIHSKAHMTPAKTET